MYFAVDARPRKRNRWDNELSSQEDPVFSAPPACPEGLEEGEVSPV